MPRVIEEPAPRRPAYFWWLLANILALCFAVVSWMLCLHVFGNPEIPRNYNILRQLGRLPKLERHTVLDVPDGSVLGPAGLYKKTFDEKLTPDQRARLNTLLVRNYLTNFEQPLLLTYVEGDYQVERVRPLGNTDFLPAGFAVRARALVKPDAFTKPAPYPVVIEYLFPTDDTSASTRFREGDILTVKKSPNCAAILHIARLRQDDEPLACLTVIPIAYGPYRAGDGSTFNIEPPEEVRPGAEFPPFEP